MQPRIHRVSVATVSASLFSTDTESMPTVHIDHVNIRTTRLEPMLNFYSKVLSLEAGWRPSFAFPGGWLYSGDRAVIHLVEVAEAEPAGRIEHFAFRGYELDVLLKRLERYGIEYIRKQVPDSEWQQVFINDPDGNRVELLF